MKCCDMTAGMLRTPVSFSRRTPTEDGAGGQTTAWATIAAAPTRAHVRQASGRELVLHRRDTATAAVKIVCRYTATQLLERDRVTIDSVNYNILSIDNLEFKNQWLEIVAERGVPA